jgi:hypothetical protein
MLHRGPVIAYMAPPVSQQERSQLFQQLYTLRRFHLGFHVRVVGHMSVQIAESAAHSGGCGWEYYHSVANLQSMRCTYETKWIVSARVASHWRMRLLFAHGRHHNRMRLLNLVQMKNAKSDRPGVKDESGTMCWVVLHLV